MANVKNFGLIGVGSDVQFGKTGPRLKQTTGTFQLRDATDAADAALTTAGITSSAGNVTLTTGNLVLSSNAGVVTIGDAGSISRAATGVYQFSGTGAIIAPSGDTAAAPTAASYEGGFRYNTDNNAMEYSDGSTWNTIATGGNTAAIQTEIDAIETSLGSAINTDGTFNAGGFSGAAFSTPTSFTDAINQVAAYAEATDTLDEILPGTDGQVIYNVSGTWTAGAKGSTSGVQAWDNKLDTFSAFDNTGIIVQTAADVFAARTLIAPAAGITISNADGTGGNPTFALANDLAGVEGLSTTGYAIRTGDGTWTTRAITGTTDNIVVTNGDGVSSDTSIDLATVSQASSGDFVKVTLDAYGRVIGNTAVVQSDITSLVDSVYVNVSGDTMTGTLAMGGNSITGLADPTNGTDAANKNYVDATAAGLTWKTAVKAASTGDLTLANEQTVDGVALVAGDRVLVKDQTTAADNGIYIVVDGGAWTRSTDADSAAELDGAAVFVQQGTTNADSGWVQTATIVTVGTTAQTWVQFSGSSTYVAGIGLSLSGNQFDVNLGAGIAQLPTDEVGIDLYDSVNGALILTQDGTTQSTDTAAALYLKLDPAGALAQTSSGLKVDAASVTNAMLVNSSITFNTDENDPDVVSLGETLEIIGTSAQGISTNGPSNNVIQITAADASSSQKGVASFTASEFVVTSGNVALGLVPVNKGGTGFASYTVGDILYADSTTSLAKLAVGTSGTVLKGGTTPSWGAVSLTSDVSGTLPVANGGTGDTTLTDTAILSGNGTSPVENSTALTFDSTTNLMTIGDTTGVTIEADGGDVTITALATNADINLVPNGTGAVVIGPTGAGVIASDSGNTLTVNGQTGLTLEAGTSGNVAITSAAGTVNVTSTSGDITMTVANSTADKVTVAGPSAADYATGLADADLVNKYYVDTVAGSATGDVKAVKATFSLAAVGTFNIGSALPAGATILSVKANVTSADTGTGTLSIGKSGSVSAYMTTSENDTQTVGIYIAETMVTEAGSEQVIGTVAGTPAGAGSVTVVVTYQLA